MTLKKGGLQHCPRNVMVWQYVICVGCLELWSWISKRTQLASDQMALKWTLLWALLEANVVDMDTTGQQLCELVGNLHWQVTLTVMNKSQIEAWHWKGWAAELPKKCHGVAVHFWAGDKNDESLVTEMDAWDWTFWFMWVADELPTWYLAINPCQTWISNQDPLKSKSIDKNQSIRLWFNCNSLKISRFTARNHWQCWTAVMLILQTSW